LTYVAQNIDEKRPSILTNGWAPPPNHVGLVPGSLTETEVLNGPDDNRPKLPFNVGRSGNDFIPIYRKSGVKGHKLSTVLKSFSGDLKVLVGVLEGTIDVLDNREDSQLIQKEGVKTMEGGETIIDPEGVLLSDEDVINAIVREHGVADTMVEVRSINPSAAVQGEYAIVFKGDCVKVLRETLVTLGF